MQLTLTVDQLTERDACSTGLDAWKAVFGEVETMTVEWTKKKQIELLRSPLGRFVGWAFTEGLIPLWSMSGADLSGANLTRANLSRANLSGANLTRANLSGAKVCACNSDSCQALRTILDGLGYAVNSSGIVKQKAKVAAA